MPWGRVAVTPSTVYAAAAGSRAGKIRHLPSLSALDRETGKIRWRWTAPFPAGSLTAGFIAGPAVSGNTLVIGSLDGALYAFPIN
jgi:outer membrane protein assembly factor BamB